MWKRDTYGGIFVHMLVCMCEWMSACVCVCEWVEAPGQAIRYWCSCLRVCRGKWMCVYVGVCSCSLVCARSCVHVCVQGVMLCRQTAAGERWPALIWSVICWSRCTAASSSQFLSLNFTVKSLLRFSLSLFVFFLLFPCFFLKNVLKFAFLSRFQKQLFLFFLFFFLHCCMQSVFVAWHYRCPHVLLFVSPYSLNFLRLMSFNILLCHLSSHFAVVSSTLVFLFLSLKCRVTCVRTDKQPGNDKICSHAQ